MKIVIIDVFVKDFKMIGMTRKIKVPVVNKITIKIKYLNIFFVLGRSIITRRGLGRPALLAVAVVSN